MASKRFLIVPVDSSAARMPLPGATMATATWLRSARFIGNILRKVLGLAVKIDRSRAKEEVNVGERAAMFSLSRAVASSPPPERGRSASAASREGVSLRQLPRHTAAFHIVESTPTPTLPLSGGGSHAGIMRLPCPCGEREEKESPLDSLHLRDRYATRGSSSPFA